MHRFLIVPFAPFEILKDFVNQGTYRLSYLEPGRVFLSELSITNDGLAIEWNPEKVELWRYGAPFDDGFTELAYRVIESTNIHGTAFPLKTTVEHFGISPEDRNRLAVAEACQIEISRISFAEADLARQVHPERLYVEDYRPHHLRGTRWRGLMITNDVWTAAPP